MKEKNEPPKKIRIVLAEDEKLIAQAYYDGLTSAGFSVKIASNGNEALRLIRGENPDILLLDLMMPEKNGFEVMEEIRSEKTLKNLPVIILTNIGQDSDTQKGVELGARDYILKSNHDMADVVRRIKKTLDIEQ